MTTKAKPLSAGMFSKKLWKAWIPPTLTGNKTAIAHIVLARLVRASEHASEGTYCGSELRQMARTALRFAGPRRDRC
jgi:hypothetical protein